MSEPLHARLDENEDPRRDLVPYEQATGDSGRVARTRAWFDRTAPGTVTPAASQAAEATPPPLPDDGYAADIGRTRPAGQNARPVPQPAKPPVFSTPGKPPVRHLTWYEIDYHIKHDPNLLDSFEEAHREWLWDREIEDREWNTALGRAPEIDEPEIE